LSGAGPSVLVISDHNLSIFTEVDTAIRAATGQDPSLVEQISTRISIGAGGVLNE
jgi:homoserine kinase